MAETTILIPTYFASTMFLNCVKSIMDKVPNAQTLIYKNDIGWLKAANKMMQSVTTDVILLNDDTFVTSNIVEEMSKLAYSDPKIGIVGGKALAPDQQHVINYGILVAPDGNTAHKEYGQYADQITKPVIQKAVEGSCMFIKREVLDKIGYFDENYVAYREEVDLCFRAKEAGYKVISCPTATYVHFVSQTHGKLGISNDSHAYFMSKWGTKLKLGKI